MNPQPHLHSLALGSALAALTLSFISASAHAQAFRQTNLVSDIPGLAANFDSHLVNPWGLSESPTSALWVSDAGTGFATLYNTGGVPQSTIVAIPPPGGGPAVPTGQVFNPGSAFNSDRFIFASARGTITGWRPALGSNAEIIANNAAAGASYLGVTLGSVGANTFLYAADFARNEIDVFNSSGSPTTLAGSFSDATLPTGYHPFNIENLGGNLFVTYALEGADGHSVAGAGRGFIDEYDLSGNLIMHFASHGVLDSPWGMALAPSSFGQFGGDLLVGNFGDGTINAFNPLTGALLGTLDDETGNPIVNDHLWGLQFGNGAAGGSLGTLYFAAGIDNETHGLVGAIAPVPEPGTTSALTGAALTGLSALAWFRRHRLPLAPQSLNTV